MIILESADGIWFPWPAAFEYCWSTCRHPGCRNDPAPFDCL